MITEKVNVEGKQEIGQLPSTDDHVAMIDSLINSCDRLHKQNEILRKNNNELASIAFESMIRSKGIEFHA